MTQCVAQVGPLIVAELETWQLVFGEPILHRYMPVSISVNRDKYASICARRCISISSWSKLPKV